MNYKQPNSNESNKLIEYFEINLYKILAILLLLSSVIFYSLGLIFPLLKTQILLLNFAFKTEEIWLIDFIQLLWYGNGYESYLLAIIFFLITIALPIIKYIELTVRFIFPKLSVNNIKLLNALNSNWRFLDIFFIGTLFFIIRIYSTAGFIKLEDGLLHLAFSLVLRMVAVHTNEFYDKKKE